MADVAALVGGAERGAADEGCGDRASPTGKVPAPADDALVDRAWAVKAAYSPPRLLVPAPDAHGLNFRTMTSPFLMSLGAGSPAQSSNGGSGALYSQMDFAAANT